MSFRRLLLACAVTSGLLVLLPGATFAATNCRSAPGTSALDQYCEVLPSADGGAPTSSSGSNGSELSGSPTAVDRRTATTLKKSGPDGAAVLDLAGGSTPPAAKHNAAKDSSKRPRSTTQKVASMSGPSSDPLKAVASSVGSGSTLSGLLVPTLLVVGVGGLGLVWRRTGTH